MTIHEAIPVIALAQVSVTGVSLLHRNLKYAGSGRAGRLSDG